ncbi:MULTISPECIES: glycosyltransferase [unclassified Microbacterium]|uniref:glycosyltransferase n=1 Tax=unclassified Microbacterium TaxID=2609290 RepID=UPI00214C907A|nr:MULTISPECIES: glycosyltransferase [unclassified Microbacterium]MCR2785233.1 glycosyltransferase [Microbacterium sp. zg.B96]WIM16765.1 glycosyltransferase [Microbacterium sp. zg-B96]
MPARVHAILVVRPDGRTPAAFHLRRTLAALEAQTRPLDALTIVLCGEDDNLRQLAADSRAEGVISAPRTTGYAEATALATHRLQGDVVWLLAQDTAPEPDALARLAGALELAPSVAFAAPKLVRWDDRGEIVSLGVSMTTLGRTVGLADGELDQGQHDAGQDVLAADVRGVLVRAEVWRHLRGLDRGLSGADEGLDLGVRARLAGARVTLVPAARVAVAGDGVAGLPDTYGSRRRMRRVFATRTAQLHRRLVYAPAAMLALQWLAILPIALWRTIVHLVAKRPGQIWPEWAAAATAMVRIRAITRARAGIRRTRTVSWQSLAPLRVGRADLRTNLALTDESDRLADVRRSELRFFSGGGAWAVLAALVVSVVAFPALLAWPALGGGALAPLRDTVAQLWADASYGQRQLGLDAVGAADPFATIVAVIGSFSPAAPSQAMVVLWVLALPMAVLGGWFAATRVTDRSLLRITGAVAWALAPTFLAALVQPRPAAMIAHLLLPWLFFAGSVAHRSWAAAGVASLVLAAVAACAPSIVPALLALWLVALVIAGVRGGSRSVGRIAWLVVPTAAIAAPLVWQQLASGNPWGLLADPGVTWDGPVATADPAGRALLAAGFPTPDPGGWGQLLGGAPIWWVPLLLALPALLALLAPLTVRWAAGVVLLSVAALGLATAFAAVAITVAVTAATPVPIWPGAGLSLAWIGVIGAALITLDVVPTVPVARALAATAVMVVLAVSAVPALTAQSRQASALTDGPTSTLPAYVAAEGRGSVALGTIVLTPLDDGSIAAEVVWGASETLGGQSTARATRLEATPADRETADLVADLVTDAADDPVGPLADRGIAFVLLAPTPEPATEAAQALRRTAAIALDQRDRLESVGEETARGSLWLVSGEISARAGETPAVAATARGIAIGQLVVLTIALLLAIPTAQTRRDARRAPRIVGLRAEEGR